MGIARKIRRVESRGFWGASKRKTIAIVTDNRVTDGASEDKRKEEEKKGHEAEEKTEGTEVGLLPLGEPLVAETKKGRNMKKRRGRRKGKAEEQGMESDG